MTIAPGSPVPAPSPRGVVMPIGGGEAKTGKRDVLQRFVQLCGGTGARIAVVPTASSLGPEIVDVYQAVFTRLGAADVVCVRPESRAEAADPDVAATLQDVSGIFMTGGNQLKLSQIIGGTLFGDTVRAVNAAGTTVGGTSAGASILSSHMVAFGSGGATPKQRMSTLAAGLSLVDGCVIDQHFDQRNRYGRLLSLVAQSPALLGIGVDEDTGAVIGPDDVLEVVGRGSVTLLDGRDLVTNAYEAKRTAPLLVSGAVVHVLPAGSRFDLAHRELIEAVSGPNRTEAAELDAANADLRRLAEDIRADGVSPTHLRRRRARQQGEVAAAE